MSGYALIHRRLLGHHAFRNDAEAMAFAWMIVRASWNDTKVRYKDRLISLSRGQLSISVRDMATAMDRDKAWVERLWKRLRAETMIETVTEAGVTVVTICNYDQYQATRDSRKAERETPAETGARQARDTEQYREYIEEDNTSEAKASSVARARSSKNDFPRPDWADPQVWADFLLNRKRKRLSNTPTAYKGFLGDIDRIANDEWPPGRLLRHAAAKGWGSINEPDEMKNGHLGRNDRNAAAQRGGGTIRDAAEEVLAEITASRGGGTGGQGRPALTSGGHDGTRALPPAYRAIGYEPRRA
ncbi:DNA-binding transcriptional regulator YhcF (GntR family) [Sphingobium sp. B1D7B]|uniref:hypothetical protein n=1 Tax=Sphingobium sp. B1D7B TaxID=2940578 RepID=UPI0022257CE6|nr:hypothetical protein [Sphingobium sp. B1D7B]MCW2405054.1 DNA-binding transcriptional regulator YhcF (GntR family) [Sphingobium sp. B1D7B]